MAARPAAPDQPSSCFWKTRPACSRSAWNLILGQFSCIARSSPAYSSSTQAASTIGSIAIQILTGVQIDPQLAGTVGQAVFVLPNSRENEQEADIIGVELMARGGYDPRAALSLWQKMGQATGGGGPPEFLSTHPSGATRLRELQTYVDKVMPLYQAAKR